jgi:hypothetical protein
MAYYPYNFKRFRARFRAHDNLDVLFQFDDASAKVVDHANEEGSRPRRERNLVAVVLPLPL